MRERDPLCPLWAEHAAFSDCEVCAALSRARAETLEACAALVEAHADLCDARRSRDGVETFPWAVMAGAVNGLREVAKMIRSLSPSAAAPTPTPASGDALPPDRVSTVKVCKHIWPLAYLCQKCEAEKKASNPADAGRE